MDTKKAQELLAKHRSGTLTPEEQVLLDSWYNQLARTRPPVRPANLDQRQQNVYQRLQQTTTGKTIRLWPRIAAAASILLILSAGGYFLLQRDKPKPPLAQYHNDIAPGHNQATLTLANGQKIMLTKGLKGQLAIQGSTIIQANNNDIAYNSTKDNEQVSYNMLTTARGEQSPYPLVLADGSKVWLNAESSITFPTAFNGKERLVKITGEALLEVAHNDKQPFKVQTDRQIIEDIGTTFDVNAYADEPAATTTLIEGKVKVNGLLLNPGQQAINTNKGFAVREADPEQVVAWKNGDFMFKDEDLKTVMRKIARWYNVDIVYNPGSPSSHIPFGIVSRSKNISAVLRVMEMTGKVHFSVEGRRVTVSR
jgi:transmembrane sensor